LATVAKLLFYVYFYSVILFLASFIRDPAPRCKHRRNVF